MFCNFNKLLTGRNLLLFTSFMDMILIICLCGFISHVQFQRVPIPIRAIQRPSGQTEARCQHPGQLWLLQSWMIKFMLLEVREEDKKGQNCGSL